MGNHKRVTTNFDFFSDAKEGNEMQAAQEDQPAAQEDEPEVAFAQVHAVEGAEGGEASYLLDDDPEDNPEDEEDDEDEEDEEEELERLLEEEEKKQDLDFNQMIDEQVRAGNIWLKVCRSIKRGNASVSSG